MTRSDDRRSDNRTHIWVAMIAAVSSALASVASVVVASMAVIKVEEVRHATNSMKDALVASAGREGVTKGIKLGKQEGALEEKGRAARAKENKAQGAAEQKAKPFYRQ